MLVLWLETEFSPGLFKPAQPAFAKPLSEEEVSPWGYSDLPFLGIVAVFLVLVMFSEGHEPAGLLGRYQIHDLLQRL